MRHGGIRIDRAELDGPLLIVAEDDMGRFLELMPETLDGIKLYGVREVTSEFVTVVDPHGIISRLDVAPMLCVGMLATRNASLRVLEAARENFSRWASYEFPAPRMFPVNKLHGRIDLLLSTTLVRQLRDLSAQATILMRELGRLRASHEYLHNAFSSVETFLGTSNMQPCRLVFENPPGDLETLTSKGTLTCIRQVLPVSSEGLSVIQLHVGHGVTASDSGPIIVDLRTMEDREIHGTWHLRPDRLAPGWISLPLPGGLMGLRRTPELVIRARDNRAIPVPLSLGGPQAVPSFRVQGLPDDSGVEVSNSLALRAWVGLPGVRPPAFGNIPPVFHPEAISCVREIAIPFEAFETVRPLPSDWKPDFRPIAPLADLRGLRCHPPPQGMTVGVMSGLDAREPSRLSARVVIRVGKSAPIEFAIAFSDQAADNVANLLATGALRDHEDRFAATGWILVEPLSDRLLSLTAPAFGSGSGSLYFATRMANGGVNDHAWAMFYDIRQAFLATISRPFDQAPYPAGGHGAQENTVRRRYLSAEVLASVTQIAPPPRDEFNARAPLVDYDLHQRGVFCHPPPTGTTLGRIAGFIEPHPYRLLARLLLTNAKSAPVEGCLLLSTLSLAEVEQRLERDLLATSDPDFSSSGWQNLSYRDKEVWLEVDTPPSPSREVDIYFATRVGRSGDPNEFAWLYFTDVQTMAPPRANGPTK